jgi:hypothetical protein
VLLQQLGDHLVLVGQLGLELGDFAVLGLVGATRAGVPLEGPLGLGQELLHPLMDQGGLHAQLFGQRAHGPLARHVAADHIRFLLSREMPANAGMDKVPPVRSC